MTDARFSADELALLRSVLGHIVVRRRTGEVGILHGLDRFVSTHVCLKTKDQDVLDAASAKLGLANMNGATVSPITDTCSASSTSRTARKSRASRATSTRDSPGNCTKVTASATSAASAWAFGPRTAMATGV